MVLEFSERRYEIVTLLLVGRDDKKGQLDAQRRATDVNVGPYELTHFLLLHPFGLRVLFPELPFLLSVTAN